MERWQRRFDNRQPSRRKSARHINAGATPERIAFEHIPPSILERFTYDAYGWRMQDGDELPGVPPGYENFHCGFQGLFADPATVEHSRNRDFSHTLARWVQAEPLACLAGMIA